MQCARKIVLAGTIALGAIFSSVCPTFAYTDSEINDVFKRLDTDGDGKVTRTEFTLNNVLIIYRNIETNPIEGVTLNQTKVSQKFFDSIDLNHDGKLSPTELYDGIRFEKVASNNAESFGLDDLRRFMNSIGQ